MLLTNGTAHDLFHGIDYEQSDETALYFNQIAAVVRLAIERGANRLSLGQSTEIAKARFGARSIPLWVGLRHRSRAVTAMRVFLDGQGFLEVETPMLQPIYGGGSARPFTTHHATYDQQLYLYRS